MRRAGLSLIGLAVFALSAITTSEATAQTPEFRLTSTAFESNGAIPLRNSAYGENVSPALNWTGAPADAQSFALILEDPDANNFVHWVIYNIPETADLFRLASRSLATDPQQPIRKEGQKSRSLALLPLTSDLIFPLS